MNPDFILFSIDLKLTLFSFQHPCAFYLFKVGNCKGSTFALDFMQNLMTSNKFKQFCIRSGILDLLLNFKSLIFSIQVIGQISCHRKTGL